MDPKKDIKKQLSINSIPKDWRIVKLKEIVKEVMNGFATGNRDNEGIVQIRMNNVTTDGKIFFNSFIKVPKPNNLQRFLLERGDLLFNNTNSYDLVGKSAIFYGAPFPCTFSNHFTRLRFQEDKVIPEWVLLNFLILWRRGYFKSVAIRHVGQSAVHTKYLLNLKIPLPPLPEQKKIAEVLRTVDEAIEKVDEAIERTKRLKKGLMQELLTKGIGHREFKDTDIGRIPKEWEVVKLGEIVEIYDSERIPLSEMERANRKGIYPYCGANGIIDYIDDYIFDGEYVLLAEDGGSYGKFENSAYLMAGKFWVNNHAHVLKAKENETYNLFLLYELNFLDLRPYVVGSTRTKLNQEQMCSIRLPLPPLPEQKQIAEILISVDKKLELLREKKKTLEQLKKGLMNDLLTGRRRVKVEPPKETLF